MWKVGINWITIMHAVGNFTNLSPLKCYENISLIGSCENSWILCNFAE